MLVNNAGLTIDETFGNMIRRGGETVRNVNLGSVCNCTKAFFENIKVSDPGRLVNISSVRGQQGNSDQANSTATTSLLFGCIRPITLELAAPRSTATCIVLGFVEANMLVTVPKRVKEMILRDIPTNWFATPEDIAGIVRFLASEDSSSMTGQVLGINGGMER